MMTTNGFDQKILNTDVRHDFILLFDVKDGNPNGDPDAGNMPRVDPETMHGLVTDVAIKRKVRDWVAVTQDQDPTRQIYVQHRGILTNQQKKAYEAKELPDKDSSRMEAREWMCQHFYDIRMFGAVMSTKKYNSGQVRGPVQITFARSIDQVTPLDISITRVALTNPDDVKGGSADDEEARSGQMGRKAFLPYGLYMAYGFFNPVFAKQTGVTSEDLSLLWESLVNMWTIDRSATRGMMACRGLHVFTHDNPYGNAPAQDLFDLLAPVKKEEVAVPRHFRDYEIRLDVEDLPTGVTYSKVWG